MNSSIWLNRKEKESKSFEFDFLTRCALIRANCAVDGCSLAGAGASDQERRARIAMEVEECLNRVRGARLYQIYQVLGIRREDELAEPCEFKPETTLKLISRVLARERKPESFSCSWTESSGFQWN